ncbi:MAG: lysylphosphatidylglycerol synthase domain-containing protein [Bacteroidota bacterium]|nr:lysylphosphatidylglycerol synthase domain-containing protein [Bacteroidota bacterium]MDP3143969.1 lysylphosphatidylglycerol synthase domain-containing protein [Bacteroidota bacterium]
MRERKKIISTIIKLLIGFASFLLIYSRLKTDLTPEKLDILSSLAFSPKGMLCFGLCFLLIPINWGIESYKWQLITAPIEKINFKTANHSVYSGICLGNLAPGRATEFLAKIVFFRIENRPKITALHFINGMFQLCITYIIGLTALILQLKQFEGENVWLAYTTSTIAVLVFGIFIFCLLKIDYILNLITKKIGKQQPIGDFKYQFTAKKLFQLFGLSLIRYLVFSGQFILLLYLFHQGNLNFSVFIGVAIYFLITTTIPMISILEAPIRAAIALIVFHNSGISNSALALSSVLIWLINIIVPSIYGYSILLKQNFDFKIFGKK